MGINPKLPTNIETIDQMPRPKPIVFVSGAYGQVKETVSQQLSLLRALNIAQDPNKFKHIIRARAAVDVFRTLDKVALRKEYHAALDRHGLNFDAVLLVLKKEMNDPDARGGDRIKAAQIILKSLGLDKYEDSAISGGSWEDEIIKAAEKGVEKKFGDVVDISEIAEYEVEKPQIPDSVKKQRKEQEELGKSLYEN